MTRGAVVLHGPGFAQALLCAELFAFALHFPFWGLFFFWVEKGGWGVENNSKSVKWVLSSRRIAPNERGG